MSHRYAIHEALVAAFGGLVPYPKILSDVLQADATDPSNIKWVLDIGEWPFHTYMLCSNVVFPLGGGSGIWYIVYCKTRQY